ncbi:hypothetical protein Tco_0979847, partial [Tanacetum coccineum]
CLESPRSGILNVKAIRATLIDTKSNPYAILSLSRGPAKKTTETHKKMDYGWNTELALTTKRDDDYDPHDDDLYESHDMSENLQAICDDLDSTICGRKKK